MLLRLLQISEYGLATKSTAGHAECKHGAGKWATGINADLTPWHGNDLLLTDSTEEKPPYMGPYILGNDCLRPK